MYDEIGSSTPMRISAFKNGWTDMTKKNTRLELNVSLAGFFFCLVTSHIPFILYLQSKVIVFNSSVIPLSNTGWRHNNLVWDCVKIVKKKNGFQNGLVFVEKLLIVICCDPAFFGGGGLKIHFTLFIKWCYLLLVCNIVYSTVVVLF